MRSPRRRDKVIPRKGKWRKWKVSLQPVGLERAPFLNERLARETFAGRADIVAAQLAQCVGHELRGDSLAPSHVKIRVIERLGNPRGQRRSLGDSLIA